MARRATIAILTVVAVLGVRALFPFSAVAAQSRNMRAAEAFMPTGRAAIASDQRFERITLTPYTGDGGSLGITGSVRRRDLGALKQRVEATSPPAKVTWLVQEFDDAPTTTTPAVR